MALASYYSTNCYYNNNTYGTYGSSIYSTMFPLIVESPFKTKREFFKYLKEKKLFGLFCAEIANLVQTENIFRKYTDEPTYKYMFIKPRDSAKSYIQTMMETAYNDNAILGFLKHYENLEVKIV